MTSPDEAYSPGAGGRFLAETALKFGAPEMFVLLSFALLVLVYPLARWGWRRAMGRPNVL